MSYDNTYQLSFKSTVSTGEQKEEIQEACWDDQMDAWAQQILVLRTNLHVYFFRIHISLVEPLTKPQRKYTITSFSRPYGAKWITFITQTNLTSMDLTFNNNFCWNGMSFSSSSGCLLAVGNLATTVGDECIKARSMKELVELQARKNVSGVEPNATSCNLRRLMLVEAIFINIDENRTESKKNQANRVQSHISVYPIDFDTSTFENYKMNLLYRQNLTEMDSEIIKLAEKYQIDLKKPTKSPAEMSEDKKPLGLTGIFDLGSAQSRRLEATYSDLKEELEGLLFSMYLKHLTMGRLLIHTITMDRFGYHTLTLKHACRVYYLNTSIVEFTSGGEALFEDEANERKKHFKICAFAEPEDIQEGIVALASSYRPVDPFKILPYSDSAIYEEACKKEVPGQKQMREMKEGEKDHWVKQRLKGKRIEILDAKQNKGAITEDQYKSLDFNTHYAKYYMITYRGKLILKEIFTDILPIDDDEIGNYKEGPTTYKMNKLKIAPEFKRLTESLDFHSAMKLSDTTILFSVDASDKPELWEYNMQTGAVACKSTSTPLF